jgi:hypothetical protein
LPPVEVAIPDCVVCYSQEEVAVAYGVWCRQGERATKVYRRYHEFRAINDRLGGSRIAHALALGRRPWHLMRAKRSLAMDLVKFCSDAV